MFGRLRIIITFSLSILILALVGAYAYQSTKRYKESSEWVSHTQQVITEAQAILLQVQDIETAQRGFVISDNNEFLVPYNKGLINLPIAYRHLDKLISDNPSQRKLFAETYKQIQKKCAFAKKVVNTRSNSGFEDAQKLVISGTGENLMVEIRSSIEKFITNERLFLSKRLHAASLHFETTINVILVSIILAILFIVITLYFYLKDHNRRLRSEKQVKDSEQRVKKFLESLPLGVYVLGADRTPYYSNTQSVKILGPGVEVNTYENLRNIYKSFVIGTDEPYPAERRAILRALKGETNIVVEDLEVERDGIRVPLRINATNITDENGRIEYAIAVFEDITEVKEAENKLREAKKMAEESSQLKEAFLANMSHEIRTPMNAIIGFTDLLLKKKLDEEEQSYVQTIKSSGENLLRIINDVLDISKIESGLMTFELHPINITELFASIQVMFAQQAKDKQLRLSFNTDERIPGTILGDPTRLTQIIINLLGNALKFTRSGSVDVSAKLVTKEEASVQIEFVVKDTGIGISDSKIESIFERFTQAESHTTRKYGGTGLGLSIVKQLVELQGGSIGIKSVIDQGSEFSFVLSFNVSNEILEKKVKSYTEEEVQELSKLSILVVEDSKVNIKYIRALFENHGITASYAENGKIAVEIMSKQKVDLVLMDIEMPEMNGYDTTAYIRQTMNSTVPIVAMTAHTMAGEREKCIQMGMNAYLSKPILEDILLKKMIQVGLKTKHNEPMSEEMNKLVDLTFLEQTMRGNKKIILDTINVFLEEVPQDLTDIEESVKEENFSGIQRGSHRMKSSIYILGISKISEILNEMEKLALAETDFSRIVELKNELVLLFNQTIIELNEMKHQYE